MPVPVHVETLKNTPVRITPLDSYTFQPYTAFATEAYIMDKLEFTRTFESTRVDAGGAYEANRRRTKADSSISFEYKATNRDYAARKFWPIFESYEYIKVEWYTAGGWYFLNVHVESYVRTADNPSTMRFEGAQAFGEYE